MSRLNRLRHSLISFSANEINWKHSSTHKFFENRKLSPENRNIWGELVLTSLRCEFLLFFLRKFHYFAKAQQLLAAHNSLLPSSHNATSQHEPETESTANGKKMRKMWISSAPNGQFCPSFFFQMAWRTERERVNKCFSTNFAIGAAAAIPGRITLYVRK